MNRRNFLRSCAAAFVGASIPFTLRHVSAWTQPIEFGLLKELQAFGLLEEHRAGRVKIMRNDDVLMDFAVSTFGGQLFWHAPSGNEPVVILQDLRVVTSPGLAAVAYVHIGDVGYIKDEQGNVRRIET